MNIYAISIGEADGFGIIRAIVDHPSIAHRKLAELGYVVSFTDVMAVRMRNEPGGLKDIAKILGDAGINIDYAYAYSSKKGSIIVLRVDHINEAINAVQEHGGHLVSEGDIEE